MSVLVVFKVDDLCGQVGVQQWYLFGCYEGVIDQGGNVNIFFVCEIDLEFVLLGIFYQVWNKVQCWVIIVQFDEFNFFYGFGDMLLGGVIFEVIYLDYVMLCYDGVLECLFLVDMEVMGGIEDVVGEDGDIGQGEDEFLMQWVKILKELNLELVNEYVVEGYKVLEMLLEDKNLYGLQKGDIIFFVNGYLFGVKVEDILVK